jgi:hypothetical protein
MHSLRWWLLCLALTQVSICTAGSSSDEGTFVGWRGDSFDHKEVFGSSQEPREAWIETLSWSPRAFLYHNFLSSAEADALVHQAAPSMKRSTVVGDVKKKSNVVDNIRTSYGTFLERLSSPAIEHLERKLANWTQLPIVNQEDVQVCPVWCVLYARFGTPFAAKRYLVAHCKSAQVTCR